jgi:hypothetical protein
LFQFNVSAFGSMRRGFSVELRWRIECATNSATNRSVMKAKLYAQFPRLSFY